MLYLDNYQIALQIDALRKKNTNAVNFIPLQTIRDRYVDKGRYSIIVKDDRVIGYLLHGAIKTEKPVVLTQIVVREGYYTGLQLFRAFYKKAKEQGCSAIRVRCAATLPVKWSNLGFTLQETLQIENSRKRAINIWILPLNSHQK